MNHVVTSYLVQSVYELKEQQRFEMENVRTIFQLFNTKYLQTVRWYRLCSVCGLVLFYHNSCTCETVQFCSVAMAISSELSLFLIVR